MENRPEFTEEQERWICYVIWRWYFDWKDKLTECISPLCDDCVTPKFGFAKEELKQILCGKYTLDPLTEYYPDPKEVIYTYHGKTYALVKEKE